MPRMCEKCDGNADRGATPAFPAPGHAPRAARCPRWMVEVQMPDASISVAARLAERGTDVARAALGALLVSLGGLLVASAASALLGRAPHTGFAAIQAMASAALAGGAVL